MPVLQWIGKEKVINHHLNVPYRVLERKYSYDENGQHEDDNGTRNMVIHGDNLEVLKSLLPEYEGLIKCIYIDPPYNTAKSSEANKQWVYSDNVDDPKIKEWLDKVVGDEGEDLSRHDKWLCMMYPRLKLLYKLLADDGIIFISIDDNEQHLLRIICDEIFGKSSFLTQFVWKSDGNFDNQAKIKVCHEYILCYIKKPDKLGLPNGIAPNVSEKSKIFKPEIRNTVVKNGPKNPMSVVTLKKGFPCAVKKGVIEERYDKYPYYHKTVKIVDYKLSEDVDVESGWSSKNILLNFIDSGFKAVKDSKGQETVFEITESGTIEMVKKRESVSHVLSVLTNLGSTQNTSNDLAKMGLAFDFPKPVDLVTYLIGFYCDDGSMVLDSFAGSGTTAHAVLSYNKRFGKNLNYILIEMNDYAENITAYRVKCAISGYGTEEKTVEGLGGAFSYYELGAKLFVNDILNENVNIDLIRKYIYFTETKKRIDCSKEDEPFYLGTDIGISYYFYYIKSNITTLNREFLHTIKTKSESYVIFADSCTLSERELEKYHITFKKIPRDISRL